MLAPNLLLLCATWLSSPSAAPLLASHEPAAPASQRLIAAVPAGAIAVGYCESLPRLRERAAENAWYQMMGTDAGEAWRTIAREALRDGLHGVGRGDELVSDLWNQLPGGAVVFGGWGGGGLVLEIAGIESRLDALLDSLLEGPRAEWQVSTREHRGLTLELIAPAGATWEQLPPPPADPEGGREPLARDPAAYDSAALIVAQGDGHLFFLAGENPAQMLALARGSIDGWHAGASPSGDTFRAARASVGAAGLELFVDLSPLMEEARKEFSQAESPLDVDPIALLGLEGEAWVYGTLDLFAGDRLEARGRLAIPRGGVAARALATLRPLPADLLARVPSGAWGLSAFGWDLGAFFDLVAEVARELFPEDEGLTMEGLVETGKGMTGVDLEQDIIRQMSGLFLSYALEPSGEASRAAHEHLTDSVWLLGLRDANRFQNALEQLLGLVPGELREDIRQTEVAGADVYHYAGGWDVGFSPGLAFAPDALLFTVQHELLETALETLARSAKRPSLLDVPRFSGAFDESRGAVAFGALELRMLEPHLMPRGAAPREQREAAGESEEADPFQRLLVWSVRPSAAGLDFRLLTR